MKKDIKKEMFRDDPEGIGEKVFEVLHHVFQPLFCVRCGIELPEYKKGMGFVMNEDNTLSSYCVECAEIINPKVFNMADFRKKKKE